MARVFNFNPGPAVLPEEVLEEVRAELLDFKGSGMSILESSHRGKEYDAVHTEAVANITKLLGLPENYGVIFVGGGATLQFSMVAMNLLRPGQVADYVLTGEWSEKASKEAKLVGQVKVIANTGAEKPACMPKIEELKHTPGAAYLHLTSNETIAGTQWKVFPKVAEPIVCDMSSDILSRPIDVKNFGLIYAGAQKNLGPAGVAVVIVRKDLVDRVPENVPMMLRYKTHLDNNSLYNTPPCFAIYMVALVTRWLLHNGGVESMAKRNQAKAAAIYNILDNSKYYKGTAAKEHRSDMNITFRLPSEALEEQFVKEASKAGLKGLKGHRSVGGVRASIYNAFPVAGVDALVAFMRDFEKKNG